MNIINNKKFLILLHIFKKCVIITLYTLIRLNRNRQNIRESNENVT